MNSNQTLKHFWIRTFVRSDHDFRLVGDLIVSTTSGPAEAVALSGWFLWGCGHPPAGPCSQITMRAPVDLYDPTDGRLSLQ